MTPDEIRNMFEECITGQSDISVDDCIWALLDDVTNAVRMAEGNTDSDGPVTYKVVDYLENNYAN